ncbi:MAG: cation transporter [Cyanobacteria bacterium SZAS LIN-5]|nr:cation transporter [Cyanobacteria bacterium SZAS LIN-5]
MLNTHLSAEQTGLIKLGNKFEYWTMLWNLLGLGIFSWAISLHPSIALLGMQILSLIHLFASAVILAQITGIDRYREHLALKVIAFAYGAATLYMLSKTVVSLMIGKHYDDNYLGILWLGVTYFVMLTLSRKKRRIGHSLQNQLFINVSDMNRVDAYLALVVAAGLLLSAICKFFWADPVASLIVVGYMCEEGIAAWKASVEHARVLDSGS